MSGGGPAWVGGGVLVVKAGESCLVLLTLVAPAPHSRFIRIAKSRLHGITSALFVPWNLSSGPFQVESQDKCLISFYHHFEKIKDFIPWHLPRVTSIVVGIMMS